MQKQKHYSLNSDNDLAKKLYKILENKHYIEGSNKIDSSESMPLILASSMEANRKLKCTYITLIKFSGK